MNTINSTLYRKPSLGGDKALSLPFSAIARDTNLKDEVLKGIWLFCFVQFLSALTIRRSMIIEEIKCPKIEFIRRLKKQSMNSYSYICILFRRFSFNHVH